MGLKVAAYCRVSTDKEDQANSLQSQKRYFYDYIHQHEGWTFIEIYADEGISGTSTRKRAAFNRMIKDAGEHKIDLILTKEVSRFARNTVDTLEFTRRLKALNVGVLFITDHIDTRDNDGEFRLSIMASVAQEESRKTSERVKWGQRRSMERGVAFGSRVLGYTIKDGALRVNPDETEIVKKIFMKFAYEGKGTTTIAKELYEEGIPPVGKAQRWSASTILQILKNEKYTGDLLQKKYVTADYLTHKRTPNPDPDDVILLKNHHQAIIDPDIWERTQQELEKRAIPGRKGVRYSVRYWCSGKIKCGICGASYTAIRQKRKDGTIYEAWACYNKRHYGYEKKCGNTYLNAKALLAGVRLLLLTVEVDRAAVARQILRRIQKVRGAPFTDTLALQEIMELRGGCIEALYGEVVESIVTCKGDLVVRLAGLPSAYRMSSKEGGFQIAGSAEDP